MLTEPITTFVSPSGAGPSLAPLVVGRDLSPAEAARLVADGVIVRCVGDVMACADPPPDAALRARCVAEVLARESVSPLEWVVGHEAAAWVHTGYAAPSDPWRATTERALERVVVLGPRARMTRFVGTVVYRQSVLAPGDVVEVGGVRVTGAVRTAADLLRRLPPPEALRHVEAIRSAQGIDHRDVEAALRAQPGARGVARARRLLRTWAA